MAPERGASGTPFPPGGQARIEAHIAERIQDFDVPALLDVLAHLGYTREQIEFRSHRSQAHQGKLLQSIEFLKEGQRRVVITTNLGLLTAQTPLPSFFFKNMNALDQDLMEAFIGFFDDVLLRARFQGLFPERDEALLPRWGEPESLKDRLTLLRLACPSSLHWLFTHVFPEAEVMVRRASRPQRLDAPNLLLGYTMLGEGPPMGGFAHVPMTGLEAWVFLDESTTSSGLPWATEAQRRLDQHILPRLVETAVPLTVFLVLRELHGFARLHHQSYVAFDPMKSGQVTPPVSSPDESAQSPKVIILFEGMTSEFQL